ncbi:hypothetical protein V8C86DRAFT_2556950, partial [Haematococcus lacustris]
MAPRLHGELVWVQSYDSGIHWPGQVVDPNFESVDGLKASDRPDNVLVRVFGANFYRWYPPSSVHPFKATDMVRRGATKVYQRAVDEVLEVQARRVGNLPKTNHNPVDMLDRSTWPSSEFGALQLPGQVTALDLQLASLPADALSWIKDLATSPP